MELFINGKSTKSMGFHLNPLYVIQAPQAKTVYVDIPYSDGSLDLTEAVTGSVKYQDRLISFTLEKLRPKELWQNYYYMLVKSYHGKTVRLTMPDMEGYYFIGRMTVGEYTRGDYLSIPVEVNCKPYRLKENLTSLTVNSTATEQLVMLENELMETVPAFTTDAEVTIKHGTSQWVINPGTHTLAIVLQPGANEISLQGDATVLIEYQEGTL